jgi:hypothetical protein
MQETCFGHAVDDGALGRDVLGLVERRLDHLAGLLRQVQRQRQVCGERRIQTPQLLAVSARAASNQQSL